MELGGNAPFIVFDDADLDAAVEGAIARKFRNAGQTCVCANRIYVQDGVYDAFAEKLAAKVSAMKVGDGIEEGTQIGPLIDADAVDKVENHLADADGEGRQGDHRGRSASAMTARSSSRRSSPGRRATWRSRPRRHSARSPRSSASRPRTRPSRWPTTPSSASPPISTPATSGGLTRVAEALEYGMVGVNTGIISTEVAPFGGVKQSGLGREGSRHGIEEYLEMKYICLSV